MISVSYNSDISIMVLRDTVIRNVIYVHVVISTLKNVTMELVLFQDEHTIPLEELVKRYDSNLETVTISLTFITEAL